MFCPLGSRWFKQALLCLVLISVSVQLAAQKAERKSPPLDLPTLLKFDYSQHFNPGDRLGKFATDRFKFSTGTSNLLLQYSNQAPAFLAGKQFLGLPAGYHIAEFTWKRKWGSLHGFRTTGYNTRFVQPAAARKSSGLAFEMPKAFAKTRLSGFFLHGGPAETAQDPNGSPTGTPAGSQAGVTLVRDFKKGFKLQSEWTQSWQPTKPGKTELEPSRGWYLKLSGSVLKAETSLTYRSQGEGLANPAFPVQGRGRNTVTLEVRRAYRKHQFQYSNLRDSYEPIRCVGISFLDNRQESLRWSYSPKRWPQLSAARTWSGQTSVGKQESEQGYNLSLNKNLKRITLGMAYLRGTRFNHLTSQPTWDRTGWSGDASFEVKKNRRLNIHWEFADFNSRASSQVIASEVLALNTRLSFWGDKLAFQPTMDFRHQGDNRGTIDSSILSFVFSAVIKLPRRFPGTDLLITSNARHMSTLGRPSQHNAGLVIQWNFKRS